MLVKNQKAIVKWNGNTKQHYIEKGYKFTKTGEEFEVNVEDLTSGNHTKVKVVCDYCGDEVEKDYSSYLNKHDEKFGDACSKCNYLKQKAISVYKHGVENPSQRSEVQSKRMNTFIERYGVENPSQIEEVKAKKEETFINKYGVTSPMKSKEVQEKTKQTCLERYGVEYVTQTAEMKEKTKQTCLERYGVDNPSKSPEIKEKIVKTWIEKYGVENIMELDEFREKILQSFVKNGNCPTSSMQIKVSETLKEIYGKENVEDNVAFGRCLLDMVLLKDGFKINVEYDGWFWHKNRENQDNRRNFYLLKNGFKILRIRSNCELPTKDKIIEAIDYLVKGNHSLCYIDLDI
ncbi:MAG: DUF7487 domain-containing protein [Sarcina sp.]